MKTLPVVLLIILSIAAPAQQQFIKTSSVTDFGYNLDLFATSDNGFVIFSTDSLKLSKFNACGQAEWSKKFYMTSLVTSLSDFIRTSNGDFVFLSRVQNGAAYSSAITRMDGSGNLVWSKTYVDADYTHFPYTISEDQQGNIFVFSNVENINNNVTYNLIIKLNPSGNLIWTKFYDHGGIWGGAICTSDNGLLIRTGNTYIKINNAGNVQWSAIISGMGYYYKAATEVSDGFIITGYSNGSQNILFAKIDKSGNLLWSDKKKADVNGIPPDFYQLPNGNIAAVFKVAIGVPSYPTVIEFDKDLNIIKANSLNIIGLNPNNFKLITTYDGLPLVAAITGSGQLLTAKLDNNFKSTCDISGAQFNLVNESVSRLNTTTTAINYPLTEINLNFTSDTFSMEMNNSCFNQKQLELGNDTNICMNTEITLKNLYTDIFDSYLWSTGDTTPTITVSQTGTYWLQAGYHCGEFWISDTIKITMLPVVEANLGDDFALCADSSATLKAPPCSGCYYLWSNGSTNDLMNITEAGIYWLSITNINGCSSSDSVEASLAKCNCDLYVPNAFTPDDDGINDRFGPVFDCEFYEYHLKIFNRWGQLIFTTADFKTTWDGQFNNEPVKQDIYLYSINYRPLIKGKISGTITRQGTIAVIY